jgi:hypothetical protein
VNPLQGEGIAPAIVSGRLAAEAVIADPTHAGEAYAEALADRFGRHLAGAAAVQTALVERQGLSIYGVTKSRCQRKIVSGATISIRRSRAWGAGAGARRGTHGATRARADPLRNPAEEEGHRSQAATAGSAGPGRVHAEGQRRSVNDEVRGLARTLDPWLAVPQPEAEEMCSECATPLAWHSWRTNGLEMVLGYGPMPGVPGMERATAEGPRHAPRRPRATPPERRRLLTPKPRRDPRTKSQLLEEIDRLQALIATRETREDHEP